MFRNTFELYNNDMEGYEKILQEAKQIINKANSNQFLFFEWLATQVTVAQLSELYIAYEDINKFCQSRSIIKDLLFEITDIEELNKVRNTVESNKVFRMHHKRNLSKMSSVIRFYILYVKENRDIFEKKMVPVSIQLKNQNKSRIHIC